jgi:hypothetical protein
MQKISIILSILALTVAAQTDPKAACRSSAVKHKFDLSQGYAHGRKGYVVDHICSIFNHGIDDITNMQYQTIADAKAKDRIENTAYGKKLYCNSKNSTPTRKVFNCK